MSNIIYLTSRCNLNCEYCYEQKDRIKNKIKQFDLNIDKLKEVLDNLVEKNKDKDSISVVLFGGEPTLRFDLIEFTMNYVKNIQKPQMYFTMATNGIKLLKKDFYERVKKLVNENLNNFTIEISYDGSGTFRRKDFFGRDKTNDIFNLLKKIDKDFKKYRIRYTIHNGNFENIKKDLVDIYKNFSNVERIVVSINYSEIYSFLSKEQLEKFLIKIGETFYNKTKIPICEFSCNVCEFNCKKNIDKHKYYIDKDFELESNLDKEKFNHFTIFNNKNKEKK